MDTCSLWWCGEAGYLLLTAQESCEWFCPSCVPSKLPAASLSLLDINNSSMLLQSKIEEVSSTLSNTELSGVSNTSLQHSGSHSEDCAKKRSAKNRKYYETHKARILANRKQKYKENAEVEKAASRLRYDANPEPQKTAACAWSKAKYSANPEPQKTAACAWSKAKYSANPKPQKTAARAWSKAKYSANPKPQKTAARAWSKAKYSANPEPQKTAARVSSKTRYAKNPKLKIGHSKKYAKNKQIISAKKRDKYSLCEPKLAKIEMYLQEIEANLLENSKARLALIKALKKQHETQAEQARRVLGKTACRLAAKRLLNKALQVRKEHAGCLLKMARSIQNLQIKGKNDFGESSHTGSTEPYFYDSAYQLVKRPHAIPIEENGKCIIAK